MKYLAMILTAMFAGARLAGAITWSWWLVFSPLIIYFGFYALLIVLVMIVSLILQAIDELKRK